MGDNPWDGWIPGVLSETQIKTLCERNHIINVRSDLEPDASSLDLHLSGEGYRMAEGSVKPFGNNYLTQIKEMKLVSPLSKEKDGTWILKPKSTYVFRIAERFGTFVGANFHGQTE